MLYEKFFGYKSREFDIPVDRNSQFRIGSNSKTFTTIAILQLYERGMFDIYDNISDHLTADDLQGWGYTGGNVFCPKFNQTGAPCQSLTFYDLMTMRSGLVNALGCWNYAPGSWPTQYCAPEIFAFYYRGSASRTINWFINVPLLTQPGTKYNYNNGNTIILAFFVEKFSGLIIEEYMRINVFGPLGLTSTSQDNLAQQMKANPDKVELYFDYTDLSVSNDYFAYGNAAATTVQQGTQTGAGGFLSTAHDMVKFYTSLFVTKNASNVISDASLALMIQPLSVSNYHPEYGQTDVMR